MPTLFDPLGVGNIELDNRIVMSPMTRSRANDEGIPPPYAATYYGQRASAGLIISGVGRDDPRNRLTDKSTYYTPRRARLHRLFYERPQCFVDKRVSGNLNGGLVCHAHDCSVL